MNLPPVDGFHAWAAGDLVENRNRGLFAEWLVGHALGAIEPGTHRLEWDAVDLHYRGLGVEVKSSGRTQTWAPENESTPRFGIAPQKQSWYAATDSWEVHDQPRRTADVYVFCLHETRRATTDDVADPAQWSFWVIPTSRLNAELGDQRSIGEAGLDRLVDRCSWPEIKWQIERIT